MTTWDQAFAAARAVAPSLRVVPKDSSRLMRVLAFLSRPFAADWMDTFTVTWGRTIYMPRKEIGTLLGAGTLAHETVHLRQQQRFTRLGFYCAYLFPPFGWTFRARLEREAYRETLRWELGAFGEISDGTVSWLAELFSGPAYVWMAPGRARELRYWAGVKRELLLARAQEMVRVEAPTVRADA